MGYYFCIEYARSVKIHKMYGEMVLLLVAVKKNRNYDEFLCIFKN